MNKNVNFKVGDPVVRYISHMYYVNETKEWKGDYGTCVYFIRDIENDSVQLAQEEWPFSHFTYVSLSELKPAEFTKKANKEMYKLRDQAIIRAEKRNI